MTAAAATSAIELDVYASDDRCCMSAFIGLQSHSRGMLMLMKKVF